MLRDYLAANANFWYKPVLDSLLSNPLGIDGVSLLNDSHPFGAFGATWDNLTTDALSQTSLEAGWAAMTGLRNEQGGPIGLTPTHLLVGPANEREALDITGAMRGVPYSNAGVADASANVVSAIALENWVRGRLQVIVEPRIANGVNDNAWFLMDLSRPSSRPMIAGQAIAPQAVVVTSPESESMIQRDSYQYYVTGNAAIGGFVPQTIYGRIS
ncbi:MAG: hypothetical protein HC927_10820 [Deltaproteobacteria bacterium]|nr:hypothetical protein [Deltaproteobacteria bacterium]